MSPGVFQTRPEEISADSLESALDSRASERARASSTHEATRGKASGAAASGACSETFRRSYGSVGLGSFDFSCVSHLRVRTRVYTWPATIHACTRLPVCIRRLQRCLGAAGASAYGAALLPSHRHSHRTTRVSERGSQPLPTSRLREPANETPGRVAFQIFSSSFSSYLFVVRSRFN